jgi:hypothetical protein
LTEGPGGSASSLASLNGSQNDNGKGIALARLFALADSASDSLFTSTRYLLAASDSGCNFRCYDCSMGQFYNQRIKGTGSDGPFD